MFLEFCPAVLLYYCTTARLSTIRLYYGTTVLLYDKVPANKRGFLVTPVGFIAYFMAR